MGMQRTDPYGEILLTIHFIKSQYLPWRRGKPSTQTRWVQAYPTICASRIHTVNAHKVPRESDARRCIQKPEQKTREGWQNERFKPLRLPVFLQPSIKNKKNQPINSLIRPLRVGMYGCLSHTVSLLDTHVQNAPAFACRHLPGSPHFTQLQGQSHACMLGWFKRKCVLEGQTH